MTRLKGGDLVSAIRKFNDFLRSRSYVVQDLHDFVIHVEPFVNSDGARGYRLKPLSEADRIAQRCVALAQETWNCRDYVKKALVEHGLPVHRAGEVINSYIADSKPVQIISYLANAHKHAGVDTGVQRWALELEPRFGKPFVLGQLKAFPHHLKPTICIWGDTIPGCEFVGSAGVGDLVFPFTDFDWLFSCDIEDKDGRSLGSAAGLCNAAHVCWMKVLNDHGIQL